METVAPTVRCFGCGGLVPQMDGPTHRYMLSSPGCWHVYGQVLVRDYTDPALRDVHRLTVDSYAVQHPGQPTPQAIQSVCVHLMSLCLIVERGLATSYATRVMGAATKAEGPLLLAHAAGLARCGNRGGRRRRGACPVPGEGARMG